MLYKTQKLFVFCLVVWLTAFLPIRDAHHHEFVDIKELGLYDSHDDCLICHFIFAGFKNHVPFLDVGFNNEADNFLFPMQTEEHQVPEYFSFLLRAPPVI